MRVWSLCGGFVVVFALVIGVVLVMVMVMVELVGGFE